MKARKDTSRARSNVHHLRLVPPAKSKPNADLVQSLMTLAAAAARDEITGIIFAASLDKPDRFISNIVGECADRPTYALGLVSMLTDQLKGLQHDMRDNGEA